MISGILTTRQIIFLETVKKEPFLTENFTLTGGTALAGFYLGHRYSEDLDFFSEKEFDPMQIDIFFRKIRQEIGFEKIDFQQSYNRNLFLCI
ncbi:MAG: nucleotidyl transferase AbiEii/AbiGii toxin family protein, partial [Parcubacteria group bacterium]|nr:nucleotidyl transferase AbiEii/AbiGii toxin family protein [Parcubacteria group bacterium]